MFLEVNSKNPVICWWSGGITSAVACKIAIDIWGIDSCRVIMIDTKNEHPDTYRFKKDCESLYGCEIEVISNVGDGKKYESIFDVWHQNNSLNVAKGAVCSSELKRQVRIDFQRRNKFSYQVFGFDNSEINRANNLKKNYATAMPVFPLLLYGLSKPDCIRIIKKLDIEIPEMYKLGFHNNNCFKTGCVQGGIGYWQKMRTEFPDKFATMASLEHTLTDEKGEPVTMLKDQSKEAEAKEPQFRRVFLLPHPDYPQCKDISMMKGRKVEKLPECNGFCGTQATFLL